MSTDHDTFKVLDSALIRSDNALRLHYRVQVGEWFATAIQACEYPRPRFYPFYKGWQLGNSMYGSDERSKKAFDAVVSRLAV